LLALFAAGRARCCSGAVRHFELKTRAMFFSGGRVLVERMASLMKSFKDLNLRAIVLQSLDVFDARSLGRNFVLLLGVCARNELTSGDDGDALIS
jgi:hypothetical protein